MPLTGAIKALLFAVGKKDRGAFTTDAIIIQKTKLYLIEFINAIF